MSNKGTVFVVLGGGVLALVAYKEFAKDWGLPEIPGLDDLLPDWGNPGPGGYIPGLEWPGTEGSDKKNPKNKRTPPTKRSPAGAGGGPTGPQTYHPGRWWANPFATEEDKKKGKDGAGLGVNPKKWPKRAKEGWDSGWNMGWDVDEWNPFHKDFWTPEKSEDKPKKKKPLTEAEKKRRKKAADDAKRQLEATRDEFGTGTDDGLRGRVM